MQSFPYIWVILSIFGASGQIFVEGLNIKSHGSRSSGIRAGMCWQRERGDEANGALFAINKTHVKSTEFQNSVI